MTAFVYRLTKEVFDFIVPGGTSRGVLHHKTSWFIELYDPQKPEIIGLGECSVIPGLSPDFKDETSYVAAIHDALKLVQQSNSPLQKIQQYLRSYPSICFGIESALLDLRTGGKQVLFSTDFTKGLKAIPINGLIWMGNEKFMREQITKKLEEGFSCLKMKVGALDFEKELEMLKGIREKFDPTQLILRVDANGAFNFSEAKENLKRLAELGIHSIEQPIQAGNWEAMAQLCQENHLPIALDEELIGIHEKPQKKKLLKVIKPQFIILKPSLHGGIGGCEEWIELAEQEQIPWWITSALESNVGLNVVAQFMSRYANSMHQGLGTGSLYHNNRPSKLHVNQGMLAFIP